jgi:phosphoribosylanthranilate isomerase
MEIKVCGITNISQAIALDAMGVQYIGFIFYGPSKRYVLNSLQLKDLEKFNPTQAKKVGVFVNEPIESLLQIVKGAKLDMVQLHGNEDVAYFEQLKLKLKQELLEVKLIKVFRVGDKMPEINSYNQIANYFLFDTDSKLYGGTGAHFNWELIKGNEIEKPYFLSGGIGPNDIGGIEVMKKTKAGKSLKALDLNSQFEETPGIKNLEKIKTFIHAFI